MKFLTEYDENDRKNWKNEVLNLKEELNRRDSNGSTRNNKK